MKVTGFLTRLPVPPCPWCGGTDIEVIESHTNLEHEPHDLHRSFRCRSCRYDWYDWKEPNMDDTERLLALQAELARYSNPWTIQIWSSEHEGHWVEFCHDAPITLQQAEMRAEELKAEHPDARFRVVPWLNNSQWQYVRDEAVRAIAKVDRGN